MIAMMLSMLHQMDPWTRTFWMLTIMLVVLFAMLIIVDAILEMIEKG